MNASKQPYVLVLPGVECYAEMQVPMIRGLRKAGLAAAFDCCIWGERPFGTFPNLRGYAMNREKAERIAGQLAERNNANPDQPIMVVGYSGGGAMALFVAEALPEEIRLDRIILLGAAISPGYDVEPALRKTINGIVNFYSPSDSFMLGWATRTFGTMDRVKINAAGRVGFQDSDGKLLNHDKLQQVRWQKVWRDLGNGGDHYGWLAHDWAEQVLIDYLVD